VEERDNDGKSEEHPSSGTVMPFRFGRKSSRTLQICEIAMQEEIFGAADMLMRLLEDCRCTAQIYIDMDIGTFAVRMEPRSRHKPMYRPPFFLENASTKMW
jgi:hypothetical protein